MTRTVPFDPSNRYPAVVSGVGLAGGGIALALFWLLVLPFTTFAGAETVTNPLQLFAQVPHLLGAVLLVVGLVGLYALEHSRLGGLGTVAFVVALLGTLGVVIDAAIGLVIAPAVAVAAPSLVSDTGALFTGRSAAQRGRRAALEDRSAEIAALR